MTSMVINSALGPYAYTHIYSSEKGHQIQWHQSPIGATVRCKAPHAKPMQVVRLADNGTLDCAVNESIERGFFPVDLMFEAIAS